MYSGPTISCVNRAKDRSVVCPKHTFMPLILIAAQYVARVFCTSVHLHFFFCECECEFVDGNAHSTVTYVRNLLAILKGFYKTTFI